MVRIRKGDPKPPYNMAEPENTCEPLKGLRCLTLTRMWQNGDSPARTVKVKEQRRTGRTTATTAGFSSLSPGSANLLALNIDSSVIQSVLPCSERTTGITTLLQSQTLSRLNVFATDAATCNTVA
jgi:hypothetical protein